MAETAAFYRRVLNVDPTEIEDGRAVFRVGTATVLVHARDEPRPGEPPTEDHVAFAVPDLDDTCDRLRRSGFEVTGPAEYEWGRSAYLRDPEGRLLELRPAPVNEV